MTLRRRMRNMEPQITLIEAALFDLDGVIVDTARYHYAAWRRLAEELGFRFTEYDNERLKGVSRMQSLEILLEVGGLAGRFSAAEKERMAERKNRWYVEYISQMTPREILPGVLPFLAELRKDGMRIALGSASKNTGLILERLQLGRWFDAVVDGTMVVRTKPDPEVFITCAERLGGVPPQQCVVFEDAVAGVEAARAAQMYSVGVGDSRLLCEADCVIAGFEGVQWTDLKMKLLAVKR